MVGLAQTEDLSCTNTNTISKQTEGESTWPTSPRSSIGYVQNDFWAYGSFGTNNAPILNQDYHYIQTDRNELPFEARHRGVPSSASKTIYEPMVRLAQTVHLSCIETNNISKRI
jgi:hypothetical protein